MKKIKKAIIIIILMAGVGTITFFVGRQIGLNTDKSSTSTTIEEVTVGTQNIKKTLTSSGEIKTANTEKLAISTSYYFETMCVEEDDTVKKGENILKYSNGTYLTAPYDLVISSYSVPETGNKATSSNYIEVQDLDNLVVSLSISESEISNISLDQEVQISLTADTSKTYTGKITKIDSVGTYSTSGTTFAVEVSLENDGNIKIGMSVSCTINIEELTDVVAVPINGVQVNGDRKYVLVVKDGKTEEVDIETGLSNDEYVEVKSGLTGGETIQVVTTTKQSTIRSGSSSEKSGMNKGDGMSNGGGDTSNFCGNNSAILAKSGANLTLKNITVTTNASGANGVFSYGGAATTNNSSSDVTTVNISDSTITTTGDNAGGIMTTGGGKTVATNLTMNTDSYYEGTINGDNTAKSITLKLDSSSKIKLTGDSYVSSLEDNDSYYSNIDFNGYKLYVNGTAIN